MKIVRRNDNGEWEEVPFIKERRVQTEDGVAYDTLETGTWSEAPYWYVEKDGVHISLRELRDFLLERVPTITKGTLTLNFGFYDWKPEEWDKERFLDYALRK